MSITHNEVATRWLQQNTSDVHVDYVVKRGHHMFYEGETIYSYGYHFPIATFRDGIILFNADGYSVSTQRHKRIVRHALYRNNLNKTVFTLPHALWNNEHALSIVFYKDKIENAVACWRRARRYKTSNMRNAAFYLQEFKTYCDFHKLNLNRILKRDGTLATAVAVIALNPVPATEY